MIDAIRILKSGDTDDLQNLLQTFNIHSRDADNNTLLHHACLLGNVKAVRLLLDSGVHANASNIDGQTPICDAALSGSAEIISLLLRSKVDVNPPSYWGSPLIYATQNESINAMKVLIDAGASLNSPERNGLCPLHIAIQRRFYAGVYLLLSKDPLLTYACYYSWRSIGRPPAVSIQPCPGQLFPVVIHPFHICFYFPT
ncbi:unnamed protein product [Schistosoma curassoni]|nr:unnamed protein product [Schistosoma curassoni]